MARFLSNQLLVEGKEDAYAVAGLMSHFVEWGKTRDEWPVLIEPAGSDSELLADAVIPTYLQQSGLIALGVMMDADTDRPGRWNRIRRLCLPILPGIPEALPRTGLIHVEAGRPRFGVWVMPDNTETGMLETQLSLLVPNLEGSLWHYALETVEKVPELGAPYRTAHIDKARIHTWLAWQDPPGCPLGEALKRKVLDPYAPAAVGFVEWFISLFCLARRAIGGVRSV